MIQNNQTNELQQASQQSIKRQNHQDEKTQEKFKYFSAKPKKMQLNQIHEAEEDGIIPSPCSMKRNNGTCTNEFREASSSSMFGQGQISCPDTDAQGSYFGASIRQGPMMGKQEDRVSKSYNQFNKANLSKNMIITLKSE